MHSIVVFNNKGGVGKTTLLCNIAGYLAKEKEKKVLIIDADPQCNATQSLFPDEIIDKIYQNKNSFTIYNVIRPLSLGKGYASDIQVMKSKSFSLDVLPGDPRLALTEDLLATDWAEAVAGKPRGIQTTFLFADLLKKCNNYDYVILDVGPSLGAINRSVLLGADFFITPMSIDIFSIRAIENISASFAKWKHLLNVSSQMVEDQDEISDIDVSWNLKFLGYVTQQYTAKTDAEGNRRAVKAYDKIMTSIPSVIKKEFPDKFGMPAEDFDYYIGTIPNLHSLVPMSQVSRRPIFSLRAADGVVGAHFSKVKDFRHTIGGIVERLIHNIEALS